MFKKTDPPELVLTRGEAAAELGVSPTMVTKYQAAERIFPRWKTLRGQSLFSYEDVQQLRRKLESKRKKPTSRASRR